MFPALWIASDLSVVAMTKKKKAGDVMTKNKEASLRGATRRSNRVPYNGRSFCVSRPMDRHTPKGVRDDEEIKDVFASEARQSRAV